MDAPVSLLISGSSCFRNGPRYGSSYHFCSGSYSDSCYDRSLIVTSWIIYGIAAKIVYPGYHDLSFALKTSPLIRPAMIATDIPPEQALSPPVKIPRKPSEFTASRTPFDRR